MNEADRYLEDQWSYALLAESDPSNTFWFLNEAGKVMRLSPRRRRRWWQFWRPRPRARARMEREAPAMTGADYFLAQNRRAQRAADAAERQRRERLRDLPLCDWPDKDLAIELARLMRAGGDIRAEQVRALMQEIFRRSPADTLYPDEAPE